MTKITIIGAGNVAWHLAQELHQSGYEIVEVFSRNIEKASQLAAKVNAVATDDLSKLSKEAKVYLLAIKDDGLAAIGKQLVYLKGKVIAHTSGTVPSTVFQNHFDNYGVFYPLQSFSKALAVDFQQLPFCIYGNNTTTEDLLAKLAKSICPNVYHIDDKQRASLHVAAVIVNNFTNHLFGIAHDICQQEDVSFDILKPLIMATATKVQTEIPTKVQTGPAARGDSATINKHINFLEGYPAYRELYTILTNRILNKKEYNE